MTICVVSLGSVATIVQGGRHGLSGNHFVDAHNGYPAFGAGGLNGHLPSYEFEQPAVVLSSIGARCGKCFLATGRWSSLANTQVILPDPERADVRFLWYQLNDESSWLRSGTAQPFIKPTTVKTRQVLLPPLPEQRRIADILDKADAIRRKRKEAIALTEELLRSTFLEMFGDPVTNPKGWPQRPFDALVSETQLGLVRAATEQSQDRPYPYVRMNAIGSNGQLDLSRLTRVDATEQEVASSRLQIGDFLFNTRNSRELVGKAAVYHETGIHVFNNNILRVRFRSGIEPDFVNAYWQTAAAQHHLDARKAGTTSVFAIYYKSLATLPVPVPPANLQRRYAEVCAAVRSCLAAYGKYASEADRFFNSILARAFSGSLGVAC